MLRTASRGCLLLEGCDDVVEAADVHRGEEDEVRVRAASQLGAEGALRLQRRGVAALLSGGRLVWLLRPEVGAARKDEEDLHSVALLWSQGRS